MEAARKGLVFLKLGGSLITNKGEPYQLRPGVIERLCAEIHESRVATGIPLLIGHGGGSFAHVSASEYQTHKGIFAEKSWEGFAVVQNDVARLNRIIVAALLKVGEKAISVQPSAACVAVAGHIAEWYTIPMERYLVNGLLPVVHGDVCLDREKGCCIISTEEVFSYLAKVLKPERVIMAGKTDGVLDRKGNVIREISPRNFAEIREALLSSDGIADVTGGMIHKVEKSLKMAVEIEIVNGLQEGAIKRALLGERGIGTVIIGTPG